MHALPLLLVALLAAPKGRVEGVVHGPDGKPTQARLIVVFGPYDRAVVGSDLPVPRQFSFAHERLVLVRDGAREVATGPDGRFSVAMAPGKPVWAAAWADGAVSPRFVELVPGQPTTLRMVHRPLVTGRLLDHEGRFVTAYSLNQAPVRHPEGRFRYTAFTEAETRLRFAAPSGDLEYALDEPTGAGPWRIDLGPLTVEASATVTGRVVDAVTGSPLAEVIVEVEDRLEGRRSRSFEWKRTGTDGAFAIPRVPRHEVQVVARASGFVDATLRVVPGGPPVELRMRRPACLELVVSDSKTHERVWRARVQAEATVEGRPHSHDRVTDEFGRAKLCNLAPGSWSLQLVPPGINAVPVSQSLVLEAGATRQLAMQVVAEPRKDGTAVLRRPTPLTPPSVSTEDALNELSKHGAVPECNPREEIVESFWDLGDRPRSRWVPPPRLRRLSSAAEAIAAYATHPNRRVVLRVAELLCAAQGPVAERVVVDLATRFPCEPGLIGPGLAFGLPYRLAPTPGPKGPVELFAPKEFLEAWKPSPISELVRRLDAGDVTAEATVLEAFESVDRERCRAAAGALAATRSPEGFLSALRVASTLDPRLEHDRFLDGVGGAILETLAA